MLGGYALFVGWLFSYDLRLVVWVFGMCYVAVVLLFSLWVSFDFRCE